MEALHYDTTLPNEMNSGTSVGLLKDLDELVTSKASPTEAVTIMCRLQHATNHNRLLLELHDCLLIVMHI